MHNSEELIHDFYKDGLGWVTAESWKQHVINCPALANGNGVIVEILIGDYSSHP